MDLPKLNLQEISADLKLKEKAADAAQKKVCNTVFHRNVYP